MGRRNDNTKTPLVLSHQPLTIQRHLHTVRLTLTFRASLLSLPQWTLESSDNTFTVFTGMSFQCEAFSN